MRRRQTRPAKLFWLRFGGVGCPPARNALDAIAMELETEPSDAAAYFGSEDEIVDYLNL